MPEDSENITGLLINWSNGDRAALEKLLPLIYQELRKLANKYLHRERPGHTLQATALVHEAYLKLIDQNVQWQNRAHFMGVAAQLMRRILIDYARSTATAKRGGNETRIAFDKALGIAGRQDLDLIALDDALVTLAAMDEQQSRIVEMRFFGGLTHEEIAEVLGISVAMVRREWATAKAWLFNMINRTEK